MAYQTNLFINNECVPSKAGKSFPIYNPVDNSHLADIQEAGEEDIDAAVAAAQAAFDGPWSRMKKQDRAKLMLKWADLVEQKSRELSKLHTVAMGMPALFSSIFSSQFPPMLRYYAGWVDKISGESFPAVEDGSFKIVTYEPYGVCAGIGAWNGGFSYEGMKIGAAIAAGNTMIFKSSEKAPLATLALGELVVEAGFPPGVINFVSGAGLPSNASTTGSLLSSHMSIRKVAFTGTEATGRVIQLAAARSNLKSVSLELSGKSSTIVFEDADLPLAIREASQIFLVNSGQICIATSRILVHDSIAQQFVEKLIEAFEGFGSDAAMGDPALKTAFLGPLADTKHFNHVLSYIESAKNENVELLAGGGRKGETGNYILPTLFKDPEFKSKVWQDDIFGPVACIKTFGDETEAVKMANDTEYGLAARIFTTSYPRALRVAKQLQAGTVGINGSAPPFYATPFGGWKQSGSGREGGKEGLMNYLQTKTMWFNGVN